MVSSSEKTLSNTTGLNQFVPRCHDVSQSIRGYHLRCILLDSLHSWVQRMA